MKNNKYYAQQSIALMDLTLLDHTVAESDIIALCKQAKTESGTTAGICIYPQFIPAARKQLKEQGTPHIRLVTVTNFPNGGDDIEIAVRETKAALEYGADEIDVTFPYRALIAGNEEIGFKLLATCRDVIGDKALMKVIIESGELQDESLIRRATEISIEAGTDMVKTSTGMVDVNATPEAAKTMLNVIKNMNVQGRVGFKASGGVRTAEDAKQYIDMATELFGKEWSEHPEKLRIGASGLLNNVLGLLGHKTKAATAGY
ncbi:deoxyribose-phosphate aldolase [Shewanella sp. 202IG2-18]|uniref:deoxyribose-phosphate aldolase n=1 Tax=Parashewanella hymeniacidonis TaxID=2807618 RepID=UPI0019613F30|nr:deoxyribose-phosphate aldolase [Parashewanella hymeniacidonis]MBM7072505.1 deoxyribose-phosphate aldolase [Parashewanella hymeniacidonis]